MIHYRFSLLTAIALALICYSCLESEEIPLPDLNPATGEGGEIAIYEIGTIIPLVSDGDLYEELVEQFAGFTPIEIDLGNDGGTPDFRITARTETNLPGLGPSSTQLRIHFTGQVLMQPNLIVWPILEGYDEGQFLPVNGLLGGTVDGLWSNPNQAVRLVDTGYSEGIAGIPSIYAAFPAGLSYLPTRTKVGTDYFYGWVEVFATDLYDEDFDDYLLISRFGVSTTPGLRIRMGQD